MARRKSNKQVKVMLDLYAGRGEWRSGAVFIDSQSFSYVTKRKLVKGVKFLHPAIGEIISTG